MGVRPAGCDRQAAEANRLLRHIRDRRREHPHPCPSPLEGEGRSIWNRWRLRAAVYGLLSPSRGIIPLTKYEQPIDQGLRDRLVIDITPAMIEAGLAVFAASGIVPADDVLEADSLVLCEIYRAMAILSQLPDAD